MIKPYYEDKDAGIVIYCGDCREILPQLDVKVDLVLTDPPYKMSHLHGGGFVAAREFYAGGKLEGIIDFHLQEYKDILLCADELVAFHSRNQIREYAWKADVEYIALGWRNKNHAKVIQEVKSKVFINPIETEDYHPAQKPLELMEKYIIVLQPDLILDPFMGSGTTAVAAKILGRKCIGIEIEEKYCEIAAKRLAQSVMSLQC